jgi:hypothetical protein
MRNCFNIEFVHYACICMYVHTLRNKIMTAPPYSCDKLIMAIHRVIYSWKCAKMAEKVMNYPCNRFNVFSSTPLFSIHSNLYNNLIFPENSNNMKAYSIQRYDKIVTSSVYIYIVCLSQFLKIYLVQYIALINILYIIFTLLSICNSITTFLYCLADCQNIVLLHPL